MTIARRDNVVEDCASAEYSIHVKFLSCKSYSFMKGEEKFFLIADGFVVNKVVFKAPRHIGSNDNNNIYFTFIITNNMMSS